MILTLSVLVWQRGDASLIVWECTILNSCLACCDLSASLFLPAVRGLWQQHDPARAASFSDFVPKSPFAPEWTWTIRTHLSNHESPRPSRRASQQCDLHKHDCLEAALELIYPCSVWPMIGHPQSPTPPTGSSDERHEFCVSEVSKCVCVFITTSKTVRQIYNPLHMVYTGVLTPGFPATGTCCGRQIVKE